MPVPSTTTTTRPPAPTPTTTTTLDCHDSFNPACGPQRWNPKPAANQPLTARILNDVDNKDRGGTLTIRVQDPDAPLDAASVRPMWSDDRHPFSSIYALPHECPHRSVPYGTWHTPVATAGSFDIVVPYPAYGNGYAAMAGLAAASAGCDLLTYGVRTAGDDSGPAFCADAMDCRHVFRYRLDKPPFNPYASYMSWAVCTEPGTGRHYLGPQLDCSTRP